MWGGYRRSVIEKNQLCFRSDVKRNEDGLFNIEFLGRANNFFVLGTQPVYYYRQYKSFNNMSIKRDGELIKVAHIIEREIGFLFDKEEMEKQLSRRNVSIAFWDSLKIESPWVSYRMARKYLKDVFENFECESGFQNLDYTEMNTYKRFLCKLLRNKQYFLYYVMIHDIYKILKYKVKR